jgi:CRP-like cAMP-binding protein
MIGFTIALPLSITVYLFIHRGQLYSTAVYQRVGFLYDGYRRSAPWWAIHDVVLKSLLTGMLIYVPGEERAGIAAILCMIALCNLNYFRPHKSVLIFWLSQLSFVITSTKYIFAMILMSIDQDGSPSTTERVHTVGIFLIVLDVCFLFVAVGTICATAFVLRRKMRKQEEEQQRQGEQGSANAESTPNKPTVVHIAAPTLVQQIPDRSGGLGDTAADHERIVDALMEESDVHAEGRRQNIAINRQRSHRQTMLRVAQRRKLKESKRLRSVQVFKQLDDKSLSAIVDAMTPRTFAPGEVIVQQGHPAESFFIIVKGTCVVRRKTLVDLVNGQIIGNLSAFDHFGEGALITATRRHFLRTSGMSGEAKIQTRNATVVAKAEDDEGVDTMMMTGDDLEKLLQEGKHLVDVKTLMKACSEEHAQREALSTVRQVWQRSEVRRELREKRRKSGESVSESEDTPALTN